ncbi:MAG: low molecular weight phosphotyrosine protein phosphatase [Gordonia sp. (in: high G+C Gram-positive bacteria)]
MNEASSFLFVCTGNICRSPMGERILREVAARAGCPISVSSAGVAAVNGQPMHPHSVEVLTEHGFDATGFESRYLRPVIIAAADIVLCMTRDHRAACQRMAPARWKRMFTLTEFAELSEIGTLSDIMANRGRVDTNSAHLDIADPMGKPKSDYERVYNDILPRVDDVVAWLARDEKSGVS